MTWINFIPLVCVRDGIFNIFGGKNSRGYPLNFCQIIYQGKRCAIAAKSLGIQLFRERLSYKSVKVNATMSKVIMGNDSLHLIDWSPRYFGVWEGSSTNTCIHAFSFPLAKHRKPQSIVQFRIHHDRWIQGLTTHLYRVSLDLKKIIHKYRREGDTNLKIKQYTEL